LGQQLSIELTDSMTIGTLRAIAREAGKELVIILTAPRAAHAPQKPAAPASGRLQPAKAVARKRAKKRVLSPAARAALVRNLTKARAAKAANRAPAQATSKKRTRRRAARKRSPAGASVTAPQTATA
jgi:hypothetical protein